MAKLTRGVTNTRVNQTALELLRLAERQGDNGKSAMVRATLKARVGRLNRPSLEELFVYVLENTAIITRSKGLLRND